MDRIEENLRRIWGVIHQAEPFSSVVATVEVVNRAPEGDINVEPTNTSGALFKDDTSVKPKSASIFHLLGKLRFWSTT